MIATCPNTRSGFLGLAERNPRRFRRKNAKHQKGGRNLGGHDMTRFDETGNEFAGDYVREVTARYIGPRRKGLKISGPGDAACFMRQLLRDETREHFLADLPRRRASDRLILARVDRNRHFGARFPSGDLPRCDPGRGV